MNYSMTEPCDECPFLKNSSFTWNALAAHASGEFPCHKTCKLVEDDEIGDHYAPRNENTPHCAGALIWLEKQSRQHQMMRICERLGMYDRTKLNMNANVGSKPSDYRREDRHERKNRSR